MATGEEIVLKFRTESDLKAGEAAQKHLQAALKSVKEGTPAYAALKVQLDAVNTSLNGQGAAALRASVELQKAITATKAAGGNAGPLQAQLNSLRQQNGLRAPGMLAGAADAISQVPGLGGVARFATGPAALAGGVAAGLAKGIAEYAQAEEGVAKLDAALAQNRLLTDANREKYQQLAAELQRTTSIADDEWIGVLTRLTQFGSDPKTVGVDVEAVKNLAGLMGGDVQAAANAYTRALQGNFEMFGRYGIVVGEAGSQTEKLQKLQEQLAQRGGGQLEASAKTLTGQFRTLKNNTSDLFEAMGRGFSQTGIGQSVMYGLAKSAEWLAEKLGGTIPKVDGLTNATSKMAQSAIAAEAATKELKTQEDELAKSFDAAAQAMDRELAALNRGVQAKLGMLALEKRLMLARIAADPTLDTPEKKAAAAALGEAVFEKRQEDIVIEGKQKELEEVRRDVQGREDAASDAAAAKVKADADLAKSREVDAAARPLTAAREEFDTKAKEVQKIRQEISLAEEVGGLGADPELFKRLQVAEGDLARAGRRRATAKEAADKARTDAGLTGTTADYERRAASAGQEADKRAKEREDKKPIDENNIQKLKDEIKRLEAESARAGVVRQQEVKNKAADPLQRGLLPYVPPPTEKAIPKRPQMEPDAGAPQGQTPAMRAEALKIQQLERRLATVLANANKKGASEITVESNTRLAREYEKQLAALGVSATRILELANAVTSKMNGVNIALKNATDQVKNGRP